MDWKTPQKIPRSQSFILSKNYIYGTFSGE